MRRGFCRCKVTRSSVGSTDLCGEANLSLAEVGTLVCQCHSAHSHCQELLWLLACLDEHLKLCQ